MNAATILLKNVARNRLRTGLTLVAFALPMAIFVAAISLVAALIQIGERNARELRLATHHKATLINLLPEGVRRRIESIDPERRQLAHVCGMRWFGGTLPESKTVIQSLAADHDTFADVYSDAEMSPADSEAWQRNRLACVVGAGVAEQNGWTVGSRMELVSSIPPYLKLEFNVIKVMSNPSRANVMYFRRDYLSESLKALGETSHGDCNIFWIKCRSVEALRALQQQIDAQFANSPTETKTEDENAFGASFTQALGDLPGLMRVMAIVVVCIIALVAGNTMMMNFRERTRELAVFKAIGFSSARMFGMVLGESMLLALFGAALGIVPTAIGLTMFPVKRLGFLPISALTVSWVAVAISLGIALTVGVIAGAAPSYQALRLRTVDALRRAG